MAEKTPILEQPERYHKFKNSELSKVQVGIQQWPTKKMRPFDEEKCIATMVDARHYSYDNSPTYYADVSRIKKGWDKVDGVLSKEETAFWFSVLLEPKYIYDDYDAEEFTVEKARAMLGKVTAEDSYERYFELMSEHNVFANYYGNQNVLARLLREVAPYDKALKFLGDNLQVSYLGNWVEQLGPPPEDALASSREMMKEIFKNTNYDNIWLNSNISKMLATIPYEDAINELLKRHVKNKRDWDTDTIKMALSMEDKEQAIEYLSHVKRWSYQQPSHDEIRMFFSNYEFDHAKILLKKLIYHYRKKSGFKSVLKEVFKIRSPEVVVLMYDYLRNASLKAMIDDYVCQHERYALEGMLTLCHSRSKKRDWALSLMRVLVDKDPQVAADLKTLAESHPKRIKELIDEEFFATGEDGEIKVRASIDYIEEKDYKVWMKRFVDVQWPDGGSPAWLRVESLPPVFIKDTEKALPFDVINGVFALSKWAFHAKLKPTEQTNQKEIDLYKKDAKKWLNDFMENTDHTSAEHLILESFRCWDATQDDSDGDWMIPLAGTKGSVAVVGALDHYIRESRDYSLRVKHREEATLAIDLLYDLDTPEARHDLLWQADHLQDDTLRKHAKDLLAKYKKKNKLSDEEFQDLAVPEFGLDKSGAKIFDFGTRQLKMIVKGRHDICFIDEKTHRIFQKFPPTRKTDDRDKYASAREHYGHISDDLRQVFIEQNIRMERAMLVGRTWKVERWHKFIGEHPILGHLARRLLWKVLDKKGNLVSHVLPDAEGTFMDLDFEEVEPEEGQLLALVHPAELEPSALDEWVEQLADFEIIQPFDQLERPLFRKGDAAEVLSSITERLDDHCMIHSLDLGWEIVKGRYRSASAIKYTAPDSTIPLTIQLSGHMNVTYDGRVQKAQWGSLRLTELKVGDSVLFASSDNKLAEKMLEKISPVAFSEAVHLMKQAEAIAAS